MDREQFTDAVRQYVEVTAKARAAEGEPIPFEFDPTAPAWKRGALTVTIAFDIGRATAIASRSVTQLLGAGSTPPF
jgi:hypothetical protein